MSNLYGTNPNSIFNENGDLEMNDGQIIDLKECVEDKDGANKLYVDTKVTIGDPG